jgi:phage tail sheath protein FI
MNDKAASIDEGGKAAGDATGYIGLSSAASPGTAKDNNIISSYRSAIRIITDPFASRVNIVTIPGIRDTYVTDYAAEQTKEYSQAIYLMDSKAYNDSVVRLYEDSSTRPSVRRTVEQFEGRAIDNNYVATYFPDVIIRDDITGESVSIPSSAIALGALGYNDKVAYPWFAPAGFNRGALSSVQNTKVRLTAEDRNILYEARMNPISRVNVRRMLLEVKRIVSDIANGLIFEQNTPATRARFISLVKPKLASIQGNQGIDSFKIVMDSSNNTAEDIEQNKLNGRIVLVPTKAVEFIAIDFIITNSGVSFE